MIGQVPPLFWLLLAVFGYQSLWSLIVKPWFYIVLIGGGVANYFGYLGSAVTYATIGIKFIQRTLHLS